MYYLDEKYNKRLSNERCEEKRYRPQRYYDERRAGERQIVELEHVSYGRGKDTVLIRDRDSVLTSGSDAHLVRASDPILVRERDLELYYRTYLENDKTRDGEYPCGPWLHLPESRMPASRMPYYQYEHRTVFPPPSAARGGPSRPQQFYRNHPPRRRHHLDDIFLPNHDDEEYPTEEEEFRSRHSSPHNRPPVRTEVRTTNIETIIKDKPSTTTKSNERVAYDPKVYERVLLTGTSIETNSSIKSVENSKNSNKTLKLASASKIVELKNGNRSDDCKYTSAHKSTETTNKETVNKNETKTNNDQNNLKNKIIGTTNKECLKKIELKANNDKNNAIKRLFGKKEDREAPGENSTSTTRKPIGTEKKSEQRDGFVKKNLSKKPENIKKAQNSSPTFKVPQTVIEQVIKKDEVQQTKKQSKVVTAIKTTGNNLLVENKDKEKLHTTDSVSKDENMEKVTLQLSNCTDLKNTNPKDQKNKVEISGVEHTRLQEKELQKNAVNSKEDGTNILSSASNQVKYNSAINSIENSISESEIDIVKELEALVIKRDDLTLAENKSFEKQKNRDQRSLKDKTDSIEQEKGFLTQDTTPTSLPSSPQTVKKDIRIKLNRWVLTNSSLADVNKNCVKEGELNTNSKISIKNPNNETCTNTKTDNSINKVSDAKFPDNLSYSEKVSNKLSANNKSTDGPQSHRTTEKTVNNNNLGMNKGKNSPIIEDIFILEDALENIDKASEIIEVSSSPPKSDGKVFDSSTDKATVGDYSSTNNRSNIISSEEVQIIEKEYDTIEILDDDDDDSNSININDSNAKPATPIVIKIDSPDDCETSRKSQPNIGIEKPLNNDRLPADFDNLDTRGSFLWTFHQRFDDPRVMDMDISLTPSPENIPFSDEPIRSEQQIETDRVIKDMDALWNEIRNNKGDKYNKSETHRHVKLHDTTKSYREANSINDNSSSVDLTVNRMGDCEQTEYKSISVAGKNGDHNTDITDTEKNLNTSVQDTFLTVDKTQGIMNSSTDITTSFLLLKSDDVEHIKKTLTRRNDSTNIHRSTSFSHENSPASFERPIRKSKSLNNIVNNKVDDFFSVAVNKQVSNKIISHDKSVEIIRNKSEAVCSKNLISENIWVEKTTKGSNMCLSDNSNKEITLDNSCGKSTRYRIPKKNSKSVIGATQINVNVNKESGNGRRKRVMCIESSDEDSIGETSKVLGKESKPHIKQKKLKLKEEKPSRKRKLGVDPLAANSNSQGGFSTIYRSISLTDKMADHPESEIFTSCSTQPPTKYVTKAEYVKSFAKNKCPFPSIALSIEPIPKVRKIKQRRATFTCEADNETILKKIGSGERCKQKFLDLFGSVSEDEEDLIKVRTGMSKKIEENIISEKKNKPCIETPQKDKTNNKSESSGVKETDNFSKTTSKIEMYPKKHRLYSDTEENNCKRIKIQNEVTQDKPKFDNGFKISQSKDNSPLITSENQIACNKLNMQKSNKKCKERNTKKGRKDADNQKFDLSNRRASTSSTDSRSRDSNNQEFQTQEKHPKKTLHKKAERVSRSRSKESDSSILSDVEKYASKSSSKEKKKNPEKEKRLNKENYIKSKLCHKEEKSGASYRNTSSIESNNSQNSHNKTDKKNLMRKIGHRRKSLSKGDETITKGDGGSLKQNNEKTNRFSGNSSGSETPLETQLSVSENKKKSVYQHFHNEKKKTELKDPNNLKDKKILKKTINTYKSPLQETLNSPRAQEAEPSTDNSSTKHKEQICSASASTEIVNRGKEPSEKNKVLTKISDNRQFESNGIENNEDSQEKVTDSNRRNSTQDSSNSSETSLVIEEITDLPLLYRSLEGEVTETFQICHEFTSSVTQYSKITKITIANKECIDKVHISGPPETNTDTKIVKQTCKEDDDVIEIKSVIPMVDLTEDEANIEIGPQDTLNDLLLQAKEVIEELAQDQGTITLYRSEESNIDQDDDVQAIAVSIPLLTEKNTSKIKKDKDLPKQDAVPASSDGLCLQGLSNKNAFDDKEGIDLKKAPSNKPDNKTSEIASTDASQLFSTLVQSLDINESSETISQEDNKSHGNNTMNVVIPTQPPANQENPTSLEDENQRAVALILNIQHHNPDISIHPLGGGQQCTPNPDSINLLLGTPTARENAVNVNLEVERASYSNQSNTNSTISNIQQIDNTNQSKAQGQIMECNSFQQTTESFKPAEQVINVENQNRLNSSDCQTRSTPREPQIPLNSIINNREERRPGLIVRPTRAVQDTNAFITTISTAHDTSQNRTVQEESCGQHRGLPQTLLDYRPSFRVKAMNSVAPPALVTINENQKSPEKINQTSLQKSSTCSTTNNMPGNRQTGPQNFEATIIQNLNVQNNQILPQNSATLIDLTQENGEVSSVDIRLIVDIFARHAYFLAHLCQAQNGYIDYLRQQPFCQSYFRTEIALFEEQKQARLNSQSLRLVTELHNLNIRATRNLSNSASQIVELLEVNLANRNMPQQVTRSMVFLLIDQLIKPQSELFATVPLLKALIRICNIVCSRIQSKYPNFNQTRSSLTEAQRSILTQQVQEYNRLFGRSALPQNHFNTGSGFGQSNTDKSISNNSSGTISQSPNQNILQNNQTFLRNSHQISGAVYTQTGKQLNSQIGQSTSGSEREIPITSQPSANLRQPNETPQITKLSQFRTPRQSLLKFRKKNVAGKENLSVGSPDLNLGVGNTVQTGSSTPMLQGSIVSSSMNPPSSNFSFGRQHKFVSPGQSSTYIALNRSSVRSTDLPGGPNTNTLGCTPRYIPNYDNPNQNHTYASLSKSQQQSQILNPSTTINSLNSNISVSRLNSNGRLNAQNQLYTNNPMLSRLLSDTDFSGTRSSDVQQSPQHSSGSKSPQPNSPPQSILQGSHIGISKSPQHNMASQSPRHNVLCQSPRYSVKSGTSVHENSFRQPPSYEQAASNLSLQPRNSSPNHLSTEEAKKRSANLLNELLSASEDEPLFARPSSPANDNFKIKLPFTQPDVTKPITVPTISNNSSLTFSNSSPNAKLKIFQSNAPISSTSVSTTPQGLNSSTSASESTAVSLQQTNQTNISQTDTQRQGSRPISVKSNIPQSPVVLVNNAAASTSYVVSHPERTVVLNQGLAALSSIGPAAAMLNSSSTYIPINQQSSSANIPPVSVASGVRTVSPILVITNSNISQPQNQVTLQATEYPLNNEVVQSPMYSFVGSDLSPISDSCRSKPTGSPLNEEVAQNPPFVSIRPSTESNRPTLTSSPLNKAIVRTDTVKKSVKVPKPAKSKNNKKPGESKRKKGAKQIEIVDLLSSDDEMPPEKQSNDDIQISKETEARVQVELSKASIVTITGNQSIELQKSVASCASLSDAQLSISDTHQNPSQTVTPQNQSVEASSTQDDATEDTHSSICRSLNRLENTNEEEDAETIDLTWIDDIDDLELQREMDFVFIKKEEPRDEDEVQEQDTMVAEEDTTVYTVNVQRVCICGIAAQYNCVCGGGWYCGRECQLKDWESHQKVCRTVQETIVTEEEFVLNEQEFDEPDKT